MNEKKRKIGGVLTSVRFNNRIAETAAPRPLSAGYDGGQLERAAQVFHRRNSSPDTCRHDTEHKPNCITPVRREAAIWPNHQRTAETEMIILHVMQRDPGVRGRGLPRAPPPRSASGSEAATRAAPY